MSERGTTDNEGATGKHDFRLLLSGLAVSTAGDWLYGVALVVFVFDETHSAGWVGATTILRLIPYILFGPFGGVLADRFEKRTVMMASDIARAVLMFGLTIVAAAHAPVAIALGITFLATTAGTPYGPALSSLLPHVCPEDELAKANSLMSTVEHTALVVGPAIGAVLLLLGSPATAFALNGLTFLGSAFAAFRLRTRTRRDEGGAGSQEEAMSVAKRVAEGIAGIRASGTASLLLAFLVASAGLYGFQLVFVVLVAEGPLHMGSEGVGWLTAAVGFGGVAAAAATSRLANSRKADMVLLLSVFLTGVPLAALALTDLPAVALLLMAVIGAGSIMLEVVAVTILQRVVSSDMLARAFGILESSAVAAMLAGSIVAPILVRVLGLTAALVVGGLALPAASLLFIPKLFALRASANERMDELAPRVSLIKASGLVDGADATTLEGLAAAMALESVSSGEAIVREGEAAADLFIIEKGRFLVSSRGEAGLEDRLVNTLGEGDYFGEIGLLEGIPRTATVTADTAGGVYRIPGSEFLDLVTHAAAPPAALVTSVVTRLQKTHPSLQPTLAGGTDA
jgi:CRP-like cAMP-binding protein/predicted MFS family arabinose efflux permease